MERFTTELFCINSGELHEKSTNSIDVYHH